MNTKTPHAKPSFSAQYPFHASPYPFQLSLSINSNSVSESFPPGRRGGTGGRAGDTVRWKYSGDCFFGGAAVDCWCSSFFACPRIGLIVESESEPVSGSSLEGGSTVLVSAVARGLRFCGAALVVRIVIALFEGVGIAVTSVEVITSTLKAIDEKCIIIKRW